MTARWILVLLPGPDTLVVPRSASQDLYLLLKIAGAGYLVCPGPVRGRLRRRLATNLLNPKIGVLFVAMLPGVIPAGHPVPGTSLLLGATYVVETAVSVAALIVGLGVPMVAGA